MEFVQEHKKLMTKFLIYKKKPLFLDSFSQFTKNLALLQLHMDFQHHVKFFLKTNVQFQENAQTDGSYGRTDRLYHRGLCKPAFSGLNDVHSARHAGFYIEFSEWTICTSLSLKNTEETRVRHQHCLSVSINSKRS